MPVPAIFYAHRCESPLKSTNQVGRFYRMTFQNGGHDCGKWPGRSLGMKLKCQIAAIGVKNRQVCPHQSFAKFARDFRWRSNSLRSAYKIARCVAGFRQAEYIQPFTKFVREIQDHLLSLSFVSFAKRFSRYTIKDACYKINLTLTLILTLIRLSFSKNN